MWSRRPSIARKLMRPLKHFMPMSLTTEASRAAKPTLWRLTICLVTDLSRSWMHRTRGETAHDDSQRRIFAHCAAGFAVKRGGKRSEEHTSELQSLMRISYAVFCL